MRMFHDCEATSPSTASNPMTTTVECLNAIQIKQLNAQYQSAVLGQELSGTYGSTPGGPVRDDAIDRCRCTQKQRRASKGLISTEM